MVRYPLLIVSALLIAAPLTAQPATRPAAVERVDVVLSSFAFAPSTLRLHADRPIVLHLVNGASGGHNFAAPEFFASAVIDPAQARLIRRGAIEVPGHTSLDIALTPRAGRYRLRCTHTFHTAFGMSGSIIVE